MSKKRRDAALAAIWESRNFTNKHIKQFLLAMLNAVGSSSNHSLCWASQATLAEAMDLKVSSKGDCRTVGRITTALAKAGAIRKWLLFTDQARRIFSKWDLDLRDCLHQRAFLEINWSHPVWSGDLSGVTYSTKGISKGVKRDHETGRYRNGIEDFGWDVDENELSPPDSATGIANCSPPVNLTVVPEAAIETCSPPDAETDDVFLLEKAQEAKANSKSSVQNHVASQASRPDFEFLDFEDVEGDPS